MNMWPRRINSIIKNKRVIAGAAALVVVVLALVIYWAQPPGEFPSKTIISIKEGTTLSGAANILAENKIVRSPLLYKVFVVLLGGRRKVIAGDYLFDHSQTSLRVAYRTVQGIQDLKMIKVTIPEGIASHDIGRLLAKNIPGFNGETFYSLGKMQEGYLFPDTYFFYENVTPQQVADQMRATFERKTRGLLLSINLFGETKDDVIKMASIVEREATSTTDRRIIAGILWKRIANKMPLQVDPPFFYFLGKNSLDLTVDDLANNSPYNLYRHTGLPPTPIGNPGLEAISATVNPTETPYFFYLSDKYGNMHYAATHDGHVANIQKYLP